MMSKKISTFEYCHSYNLGDEIQTISAIKAIKKLGLELGEVVNRKQINTKDNINLLVNGFFEIDELNNLLQQHIKPIFSNIHIDSQHTNIDENLENFKQYEPIGCRDRHTEKIFKTQGVDAFFNYCITLTLDKRDENIIGDTVFIVDLDELFILPKHLKKEKIVHLTHIITVPYSHKAKMILANELLEKYKNEAKLVITSRLHCALPCIAMGIPVILFADKNDKRLHLAQEFIPLHPYPALAKKCTTLKLFCRPIVLAFLCFIKNFIRKIYYYIRYFFYYRNSVNWKPQKIDIEDIKKTILTNLADLIKKLDEH